MNSTEKSTTKTTAAPDSATQAQSVMKQFSKTDYEIDADTSPQTETAPGTQGKASEPNSYKDGTAVNRPGTLTPNAGAPDDKAEASDGTP